MLYNIHTHTIPTDIEKEACETKYILNIYPHQFETKRSEITLNGKFSCGIHPWYLENRESEFDKLKQIALDDQIVAIGEAGLDKLCVTDIADQMDVFLWQIKLAQELNKPLIIHCVKAWNELFALHKKYTPTNRWIVHGFRGNAQLAKQLVDRGVYISFGQNYNLEALKQVPLSSILIETDAMGVSIGSIYRKIATDRSVFYTILKENIADNVRLTFPKL